MFHFNQGWQKKYSHPLWNMVGICNVSMHGLTFWSITWPLVSCSTMALQQAQLLLNMSSLEPVNFGVQQNNTEAFAVALCHLAELHAEQVTHLIWSRLSAFCPSVACPLVSWPSITARWWALISSAFQLLGGVQHLTLYYTCPFFCCRVCTMQFQRFSSI